MDIVSWGGTPFNPLFNLTPTRAILGVRMWIPRSSLNLEQVQGPERRRRFQPREMRGRMPKAPVMLSLELSGCRFFNQHSGGEV